MRLYKITRKHQEDLERHVEDLKNIGGKLNNMMQRLYDKSSKKEIDDIVAEMEKHAEDVKKERESREERIGKYWVRSKYQDKFIIRRRARRKSI